jgi:hypothetical protein
MATGVTDRLWSFEDIAALIDAAGGEPKKRGPSSRVSQIRRGFQTESLPIDATPRGTWGRCDDFTGSPASDTKTVC